MAQEKLNIPNLDELYKDAVKDILYVNPKTGEVEGKLTVYTTQNGGTKTRVIATAVNFMSQGEGGNAPAAGLSPTPEEVAVPN